jgi:hypothetical protein
MIASRRAVVDNGRLVQWAHAARLAASAVERSRSNASGAPLVASQMLIIVAALVAAAAAAHMVPFPFPLEAFRTGSVRACQTHARNITDDIPHVR